MSNQPAIRGDTVEPLKRCLFAWTATHETADYEHFPPYVNLTGNRLAMRGPEKVGMGHVQQGDYVAVDLPPEAIAELRAALDSPQAITVTEEMIEAMCVAFIEGLKPALEKQYPDSTDTEKGWNDAPEAEKEILRSGIRAALSKVSPL